MCWRCSPQNSDDDARAVDLALAAAHERLSRRQVLKAGLLALSAGRLLSGCASVPVTGRSQLRLVSEEQEAQLGVEAFQQLRQDEVKKGRLLTEREDPAAHAWVKRVSDRVIAASGLGQKYQWQYIIINAPKTVNAAAIAGGRIIVYSGLLPVAANDAGLATVLGHETGHVMAHHTAERLSQNELASLAQVAAGVAGGGELGMAAVGLGAQVGFLLPYSRSQESEADHIGVLLMAKAGYDPRESVHLWERMNQSGGSGRPPEFLSTHPNPDTRITQLEGWMAQALQYYHNPSLPLPH
jgi:metalloendopeptidase OMA1, mitochondrial